MLLLFDSDLRHHIDKEPNPCLNMGLGFFIEKLEK